MEARHLTGDQKNFLDENGYLILRNVLSADQIAIIKRRIEEIKKEEGPRLGEIGYSRYRESLMRSNSSIRLGLFDFTFRCFKAIINLLFRVFPFSKIVSLQSKAALFDRGPSFQLEIRQMLITTIEQFDKKDDRICDLVNKGEEFTLFYRNPLILGAVRYVIGDTYKLSSLNIRSPRKNNLPQNLHVDWPWAVRDGDFFACNALWLLDEMDENNGPTRVIPGSHRWGSIPAQKLKDLRASVEGEVLLTGSPGDVVF